MLALTARIALPCPAVLTAGVNTADHTAAFEHLCDTIEVWQPGPIRVMVRGGDVYTSFPRVLRVLLASVGRIITILFRAVEIVSVAPK
jgi:hypothetical protein